MKAFTLAVALGLAVLAGPAVRADTPASSPVKDKSPTARLVTEIPEVSVDRMPLMRVLNLYAEQSGLAIEPDWTALKSSGVTKETPVTLKAKGQSFGKVLDLTLNQVSGKDAPLAWYLAGDTVVVTTQMKVLMRDRMADLEALRKTVKEAKPATPFAKEFSFDNTAVKLVLQFVFDLADVNYHVNWRALEAGGITPDTPITIKAKDITPGRALDMVLDQLSAGKDKLGSVYWIVDEGVVEISTGDALNQRTKTKTFEIADLLMIVPSFVAPQIDITAQGNSNYTGNNTTGGGGGGGGLFGQAGGQGAGNTSNTAETDPAVAKQKLRDDIVTIVKNSIGEDMWAPNGKGSITLHKDRLVITQTPLGFKLLEQSMGSK